MRVLINKLLLLSAMLMVTNLWAESEITAEDLPLWLKPELLVHLSAMKMNESQNLEFREALKECLTGMQRVVQREIRKGGVNIPKRIERGINRQYNDFDKHMKANLSELQIEPWTRYLEGLKVVMSKQQFKRR